MASSWRQSLDATCFQFFTIQLDRMARKSFTIDHILNGEDNKTANNNYNNNIHPFLSEQSNHGQFQQHDPATLAYWMGQAYYPTGSWPIPTAAAAIWLQQQQQQQPRHSSNMPVDLSVSTEAQRLHHQQTIAQQHSSLFNSNWGPAAAAAMTGCWTTNGPSPELLAYSHHGILFIIRSSPRLFHPTLSLPHRFLVLSFLFFLFHQTKNLKDVATVHQEETLTHTL